MESVYAKVKDEVGSFDCCCCYTVSAIRSGYYFTYPNAMEKWELIGDRIGHSHDPRFPDMLCTEFTPENEVDCYYLFGETLLIGHHKVGQCPWKLL